MLCFSPCRDSGPGYPNKTFWNEGNKTPPESMLMRGKGIMCIGSFGGVEKKQKTNLGVWKCWTPLHPSISSYKLSTCQLCSKAVGVTLTVASNEKVHNVIHKAATGLVDSTKRPLRPFSLTCGYRQRNKGGKGATRHSPLSGRLFNLDPIYQSRLSWRYENSGAKYRMMVTQEADKTAQHVTLHQSSKCSAWFW